jgi:hypothetical protein
MDKDKEVWKDLGRVEGLLNSFSNQIRDIWKKLDEREEVDVRQDGRIDVLEGRLNGMLSGGSANPDPIETARRITLERGDYPKVGLALLFVIGGFGSAIGWWTWLEFKSWIVDAWRTLGQMLGFGGGS